MNYVVGIPGEKLEVIPGFSEKQVLAFECKRKGKSHIYKELEKEINSYVKILYPAKETKYRDEKPQLSLF